MDDKKKWIKPELIVIMRNFPEENVLASCKHPSIHNGPATPNCKIQGNKDECLELKTS